MCGMIRYQKYMAVMSSQVYELPTFEHAPMRYGDDSVPSKSFSRQAHRQAQTPVKLLLLTLCFWRCPRNDVLHSISCCQAAFTLRPALAG